MINRQITITEKTISNVEKSLFKREMSTTPNYMNNEDSFKGITHITM
jgi:hypothetical protein